MGRHAGWIAAAGGLAGKKEGDAPHIILFPEVPFNQRAFMKRVKECVTNYGYCVIVVSEGAQYKNGKFLADQGISPLQRLAVQRDPDFRNRLQAYIQERGGCKGLVKALMP